MNILVVGYYGVLNAGDDLLQSALCGLLRRHRLTFTSLLPSIDIINSFDFLVVGGGSIWPQNQFFELADDYAERLRIPFAVVGVSARSNSPEVARRTLSLVERAAIFHVRDRKTAAWIGHEKIVSGVDLFWSTPWCGDIEATRLPDAGVALAIRPDSLQTLDLDSIVRLTAPIGPTHGWPFFYGDIAHDRGASNDCETLAMHFGADAVPASFSLQPLRKSRLVVTMRYHGLLCAIRAGRPVIVLDVHNKLGTFCDEYDLRDCCATDPAGLEIAAGKIAGNFEAYRKRTLALRERLLQEGEVFRERFSRLADEIKPRPRGRLRQTAVNSLKSILSRVE